MEGVASEVSAMPPVHINYVAVVITAILSMVIGAIWYSPGVFGTAWMALVGKKPEDLQKGMTPRSYGLMFVAALVLSFVLVTVIRAAGVHSAMGGIKVGIAMWIGFVLTTSAGLVIFEGRPVKLYWLNNGYHGVTLVINGAILAAWA